MDQPVPQPFSATAERRSGHERRSAQRRHAYTSVQDERRSGGERRYWEERRGGYRRRHSREAPFGTLTSAVGGPGSLDRERARARRLLDEFTQVSGPLEQRVTKLVRRQWPAYPLGARAFLAERLTSLLRDVPEGSRPSGEVRRLVEEAVAEWAGKL
ncbi:MAG TPA: hypothetical protein VD793_02720 [Gemmatimonadales bacterium]|nr:hypothetical protein [Gemmatimonadales bacterium]